MRMKDRSRSGFPRPWVELQEGFQHIPSLLAPPPPSKGATGGLLKGLQRGCELRPRAPGPEASPWPPCPAPQEDRSSRPQQELLVLQRDSKKVRGRTREGTRRLGQLQGRGQASGLIFSGARFPPPQTTRVALLHGSDSGIGDIHFPSGRCLCSPAGAVCSLCLVCAPLPGTLPGPPPSSTTERKPTDGTN